ncbi:MAG: DUF2723 domain-containing protein [Elusimicrobia bacterium]|nr:DUF2723 domain-containing protein [Elusimicrobiota bacterium]
MESLGTEPASERDLPGTAASLALAAALALGIFGFYLATAYPTLSSYRDSGDMAASAITLGVSHPPGYPFFTLAARGWLEVFPLGNAAYRLHVFSALLGAGACAALFLAFFSMSRSLGGGLCAALLLAFAPAFHHLSLVSEMYSLSAFLASLLAALTLRASACPPQGLCAAALLLGLGMGSHQTLLAAAPLLLASGLERLSPFRKPRAPRLRLWGLLAGFFLLGLLIYAYLPLRSATDPALNWGEPHSLRNFLRMLTRADYGGVRLHPERPAGVFSLSGWAEGLRLSAKIFAGELGVSGLILLLAGALGARRSLAAGALAAFLLSGPIFIVWANLDPGSPETYAILEPHLVLPLLFAAALAGLGAQSLLRRSWGVWKTACAFLALAALWWVPRSGAPLSHRHDFSAWDYGAGLLDSIPQGSLLVDPDDPTAFTLSYMLHAHGRRPDVVPFLGFRTRWGYEQFRRRHPALLPPYEIRSGQEFLAAAVSKALREERPIYVDLPQKTPAGTTSFPSGLSYKLFMEPPRGAEVRGLLEQSLRLAKLLRYRPGPLRADFFTRHTLAYWPSALNNLGIEAQRLGLNAEAVSIYKSALAAAPWLSESWNNWGNAAIALGDPLAAVGCYQASLREKPAAQVVYNQGRAWLLAGRFAEAEERFRKAIAEADLVDAHNDLGLVHLRSGRAEEAVREWLGVLDRNPRYSVAYYNLALGFERLGREQDALRALEAYRGFLENPAEIREAESWMRKLKKKR